MTRTVGPAARGGKQRAAAAAAFIVLLVSCLPEPAKKAVVHVTVRGSLGPTGVPTFDAGDGWVLSFDRRIMVVAVTTASDTGSRTYNSSQVYNLDVPTLGPDLRALGDQHVELYSDYYRRQAAGPGVTPADLDALDGEKSGTSSRTGVGAIVLRGAVTRGSERVTFDWRGALNGPMRCGGPPGPDGRVTTVPFEVESEHHVGIVVFPEVSLLAPAKGGGTVASTLKKLDTNKDGHVDAVELQRAGIAAGPTGSESFFAVVLNGTQLTCRPAYDFYRGAAPVPSPTPSAVPSASGSASVEGP